MKPALVRRLTTIIAIDVVGFSTMSARDEEHALELLGRPHGHGRGDREASPRPCLQADGRWPAGGIREPGRGGARRPRNPGGDALGQCHGRTGRPARAAHRHQSRRHRGKRRRPDGRRRQRRGAAGIDRAAGRHLRVGRRSTSRSSASSPSAPRTWASSTSRTSRAPSMPTGSRPEARHRSSLRRSRPCARHRRVSSLL